MELMKFLQNNAGWAFAMLANIFTIAWFVSAQSSKLIEIESKVIKMEKGGTEMAQESKWRIDQQGKEMLEVKGEIRIFAAAIPRIESDVRVISEWVKRQNGK